MARILIQMLAFEKVLRCGVVGLKLKRLIYLLAACMTATLASAKKHAFVLGNAAYEQLDPLRNTHHDADAYAQAFAGLGYRVSNHRDLTLNEMEDAFDAFVAKVLPGDEVVFSGHGWSNGSINYLIPADAPVWGTDRRLARNSIALRNGDTGVLDDLERSGAALAVAVIDACRATRQIRSWASSHVPLCRI